MELVSRTFASGKGQVQALAGVSLRAAPGEIVTVVGPSGCGKTTLLELICGLQAPDAGTVVSAPAALMPQRDLLLPWLSAIDNAALALRARGMSRDRRAPRRRRGWSASDWPALSRRARRSSRAGCASACRSCARCWPASRCWRSTSRSPRWTRITRAEMQGWLAHVLAAEPRTVVLVTHDVEEAVVLGDRVLVMSARPGRVVSEVAVALARPRRRTDAEVVALRERVLEALGMPA